MTNESILSFNISIKCPINRNICESISKIRLYSYYIIHNENLDKLYNTIMQQTILIQSELYIKFADVFNKMSYQISIIHLNI
jgi:hypothetical protein